jgi:hypothetical protein
MTRWQFMALMFGVVFWGWEPPEHLGDVLQIVALCCNVGTFFVWLISMVMAIREFNALPRRS